MPANDSPGSLGEARRRSPVSTGTDDSPPLPVFVDLDATLIRTDLLLESALKLLKAKPSVLFRFPAWIAKGKAWFKARIAREVDLDPATLPYRSEVLEYVCAAKAAGHPVILATASNRKYAEAVAAHLGLFDHVIGSDAALNLSGRQKRSAIQNSSFGREFIYVGDSRKDLPVWEAADTAVVVSRSGALRRAAARCARTVRVIEPPRRRAHDYLDALRLHQWAKNLLVFVPCLPLAMQIGWNEVRNGVLAFVAFGLCASSVYIFNDLGDLEADRLHPRKRNRPFASGAVPIPHGMTMAALLLAAAFMTGLAALPAAFLAPLAVYWLAALAYSARLKALALVDIFVLAGLYALRILAGSAAIAVPPSFWILAFSIFFFLSLAAAKRYVELSALAVRAGDKAAGRGYNVGDRMFVAVLGVASGFSSILLFALYINDSATTLRYGDPRFLWLLCPLLLYWVARLWLKAWRGELHDDPVVFALRDRISAGICVLGALALMLAL